MSWRDHFPQSVRAYLPTVQERGTYTGPFSTYAEYHALGVGFLGGAVAPGALEPLVAYGIGSGAGKARRSGHAADAAKELGYTGLGVALGMGVRLLAGL